MDYKIILSPISLKNLETITAWIAKNDPAIAERIGNELLDRIALLAKFPRAGSAYAGNKKWRKLVSKPYLIIYRINNKLNVVEILTFRHAAQTKYLG